MLEFLMAGSERAQYCSSLWR